MNDVLVTSDVETPYSYRWSIESLPAGSYAFKSKAYDIAGNVGQATRYLPVGQVTFKDIPADHWAMAYIEELAQRGIIGGFADGNFRPTERITRAEFAKMMVLAMGWDIDGGSSSFTDVSNDHWALSFIMTAKNHGIIDGYKDGSFKPAKQISRAEIAKIIALAKGYPTALDTTGFTDIADCWAKSYILGCAKAGVISGYPDGRFAPQAYASRAESSKMLAAIIN